MISPALMRTGMAGTGVRLAWSRLFCGASVLGCLLLNACDGTATDSGSDILVKGDQTQGVLTGLWTGLRPNERTPVTPVRFPVDLSPHPQASTESYQLQAILTREDGAMMSVQAQLDRLALGIGAMASSEWGFSDIMRASVAMGMPGQPALTARETVERRALGLANSDQNSIHVIDTSLELQTRSGFPAALTLADECSTRFHFSTMLTRTPNSLDDVFTLEFDMPRCPQTLSLRGLNHWRTSALTGSGTLGRTDTMMVAADETHWQGHVWLSQTWGNMPSAGGAVLIDQVNLRLTTEAGAGPQLLSASRSKRKTGRGPKTIQGSVSSLQDDDQVLALEWIDEGEQTSPVTGFAYPQRVRLRNKDESMELVLTPLVTLPEISDSLGIRWSGAVTVSGTHTGVGFMEFQPVVAGRH